MGWTNAVFIEAEDSIAFLGHILRDEPEFHSNHLLFEPLYHALLQAARALRPAIEPIVFLQSITTAFALIALGAAYLLITPKAGHTAALVGTGLIAMSFAFWHYSKVVDAYVPALALALVSLVIFDRRSSMPRSVAALSMALFAGAATLIHQLYVFHAALLFLFLLFGNGLQAGRVRDALLYGLLSAGGVFAVYVSVYTMILGNTFDLAGFVDWAKGHARNGLWLTPSAATPFLAMVGLTTGLIYVAPFLAVPGLFEFATEASPDRLLDEEQFIALNVLGRSLSILLAALAVAAGALCLLLVAHAIRSRQRVRFDLTERYLVAFVFLYSCLATFWEAVNREFWIHVLVAVALLVALRLRASVTDGPKRVGLVTVALLGVVNFTSAIKPFSDPSNDFWLRMTAPIVAQIDQDDVIVVECPWLCARYIAFFSGAHVYRYQQLDSFDQPPGMQRERFTFERLDPITHEAARN